VSTSTSLIGPTRATIVGGLLGGAATASGIALTATSGWLIVRASEQPVILTLLAAIVAVRAFGIARPFFRYLERLVSHDAALDELNKRMTTYCAELPAMFRDRAPILAEGHPAKQILHVIDEEAADLVVVGARGLGAIQRLLVGSTSEHLLAHAPCSVLIVRRPEQP